MWSDFFEMKKLIQDKIIKQEKLNTKGKENVCSLGDNL